MNNNPLSPSAVVLGYKSHTVFKIVDFYNFIRLNALEASNYQIAPLYKYVKEADKCMEQAKVEKNKRKASTLYHLTKYLVQDKNKTK